MAIIYGGPSQYLIHKRDESKRSAKEWLIFFIIVGIVTCLFSFIPEIRYSWVGPIIVFPLSFYFYLFFVGEINKFIKNFFCFTSGWSGEKKVFNKLRELPNSFQVFGDVRGPGMLGNADFVVVGPTGVFAIEVKNHKGNVTFDGNHLNMDRKPFEKDFLAQTKREAVSIHNCISSLVPYVQPVLVFANTSAKVHFGMKKIDGVYVIGEAWLNKLINENHASLLTDDHVSKIAASLSPWVSTTNT